MAKLLYEGKAKKVFEGDKVGELWQEFKDSATAFNGEKKATIAGKGELNAQISSALFWYLSSKGVATHLLDFDGQRSQKIIQLKMVPLEVVVRNRVAGSLAKRRNEKEGAELNPPLTEFFLKDDAAGDPQLSDEQAASKLKDFNLDLETLKTKAGEINSILQKLFLSVGLSLVDFKLEFGLSSDGRLILGDEISPDTCRLWDLETSEKLDKDRFRYDLGDLITGYQKIWDRLQTKLN